MVGDEVRAEEGLEKMSHRSLVLVLWASAAASQSLQFEVAVIKPADPEGVSSWTRISGTEFHVISTVEFLLETAYGVQDYQISGGPKWFRSDKFDVDAKPERAVSGADMKLMVQALLAERFHLVLRAETRELPVYALVMAKKGLKVQPVIGGTSSMSSGKGSLRGKMSLAEMGRYLSPMLGRTVVDRTDLKGAFDIKLTWAPDDDPAGPSIFTAIQEQLGLKLEPAKGPVQLLVIDRVEKPSGN